jgi:hypothetical protein
MARLLSSNVRRTTMKRFSILRDVDPAATWADVDSAAVRNIISMYATGAEPDVAWDRHLAGVRWIRSYWEPGSSWGLCLYEGNSVEQVKDWNVRCQVPFVEVREIEEQESPVRVEYRGGFHADPTVSNIIALEGLAGASVDESLAATGIERAGWVRSYLDPERGAALAVYQVDLTGQDVLQQLEAEGWKAHRIVEITPGDYVNLE